MTVTRHDCLRANTARSRDWKTIFGWRLLRHFRTYCRFCVFTPSPVVRKREINTISNKSNETMGRAWEETPKCWLTLWGLLKTLCRLVPTVACQKVKYRPLDRINVRVPHASYACTASHTWPSGCTLLSPLNAHMVPDPWRPDHAHNSWTAQRIITSHFGAAHSLPFSWGHGAENATAGWLSFDAVSETKGMDVRWDVSLWKSTRKFWEGRLAMIHKIDEM